ncbi:MAG: hypothetical protein V1784_03575, partial [bacterium]
PIAIQCHEAVGTQRGMRSDQEVDDEAFRPAPGNAEGFAARRARARFGPFPTRNRSGRTGKPQVSCDEGTALYRFLNQIEFR